MYLTMYVYDMVNISYALHVGGIAASKHGYSCVYCEQMTALGKWMYVIVLKYNGQRRIGSCQLVCVICVQRQQTTH